MLGEIPEDEVWDQAEWERLTDTADGGGKAFTVAPLIVEVPLFFDELPLRRQCPPAVFSARIRAQPRKLLVPRLPACITPPS